MDFVTAFLLAVYLVPLGLVSVLSAWSDGRKPVVGLGLWASAAGLATYVALLRPEGLFALRDIPELTIVVVARVIALF
jgi:hypothetical protein